MGYSVKACVGFGVTLSEDTELPWKTDESDDIESWWEQQCGWTEPFPDDYAVRGETVDDYFNRRAKFMKPHPLPVEVSWCGVGDYQTEVLLVPGTEQTAYEGGETLEPLVEVDPQPLIDFCKKWKIKLGRQKPRWLLYGRYS